MWFQARQEEKKLKNIMIDRRKRIDRRRDFYEKIKKDPAEFLQLHGRRSKIFVDAAIASAAESQVILRPWQGDPNVLIDRFDARSHLDIIPEFKASSETKKEWDERQNNFERYRILVLNEFEKISEDKFLKQIHIEENALVQSSSKSLVKMEEEKKKKLASQKAAIGFNYETGTSTGNSAPQKLEPEQELDGSSDSDYEPEFDKRVDISDLTSEQIKQINEIAATKYDMNNGDFSKCMWIDFEEQTKLQGLREVEDERAALAGKQSRRERKLLKDIRIRNRGCLQRPLEVLRVSGSPVVGSRYARRNRSGSSALSSSSTSSSDDDKQRPVQFITTFGGGSDGQSDNDSSNKRQANVADKQSQKHRSAQSSSSSRRRSSPSSPRRTTMSSRRRSRRHKSRSRSSQRRFSNRNGSGGARRRCNSRSRSQLRANGQRSSKSDGKKSGESQSKGKATDLPRFANSPNAANDCNEKAKELASDSDDPNVSLLSVHSDMTDSEQERRQVENTRRRLKRTKRALKTQGKLAKVEAKNLLNDELSTDHNGCKPKTLSALDKLKLQTQKALKKTLAKDKEEERIKQQEQRREQETRDEEIRELSLQIRKKERDQENDSPTRKRYRSRRRSTSSSSSESRSRGRRYASTSTGGGHRRSRSRSRSRSHRR